MSVPRVYALGNTPLVYLLCHDIASLSIQPRVPELVLLLQDQRKLNRFLQNESKLAIKRPHIIQNEFKQYMASCSPPKFASGEIAKIDNLVIGETMPKSFLSSLRKYSECIHHDTNVLLLNPTMGILETLENDLWKEKGFTPNTMIGLTNVEDSFLPTEFTLQYSRIRHPLQVCSVPKNREEYSYVQDKQDLPKNERSNDMLKLLKMINHQGHSTALGVMELPYGDSLLHRYENLIIQSCLIPISVLYPERDIFNNETIVRILRTLIGEFTHIIKATDNCIHSIPHAAGILNEDRLLALVLQKIRETSRHSKSDIGLRDIHANNGYFTLKARSRHLKCHFSHAIAMCAKAKLEVAHKMGIDFKYL